MAKPRNSVLYLFDPLHSPSTPRRESSSSELSASDKENDVPAGDVTLFFNRMYAVPKQQDVQVFTPKGKLIDIGDTPAPSDTLWDAAEHDGSDADGEQSESDAEGSGALSPPRRPFAELDFEHTPRPLDTSRSLKEPIFRTTTSPSDGPEPLPALLIPAPQSSPLADVVNSINFSSMSLADESTPTDQRSNSQTQDAEHSQTGRPSSSFPEINVCAPETPCMNDFDLVKGHDEHAASPVMATASHLRPPSKLTQLSPDDPRRTSVDLYSSFHLQMQSEEMSFDLLNDKISFLGHGHDSFWAGGDDAMEFEEMGLPPTLKAKMDKLVFHAQPPAEHSEPVFSPPGKTVPALDAPFGMSPTTEAAVNVPLPLSPVYSAPPSRNTTPPRVSPPSFDEPPSPPTSPVVADEPSLLHESEPLPPPIEQPAPTVLALRITKKTFKIAGRQSTDAAPSKTTTTARREKPEPVVKKRPSLALARPTPVPAAPQPTRPPIRGVQRPPAGMAASGVVVGLAPQGSSSTSSSNSSSSSGSVGVRAAHPAESAAPAPTSRFAGIQRPNLAAKERAAPRSSSNAVRPAGVAVPHAAKVTSGITRTTSMGPPKPVANAASAGASRPPSRIAAPGRGSALPKPASRLPGASRLTRTISMSLTTTGSGAAASRARASTLSRATGKF